MLQLNISTHRRNPFYEVKAIIALPRLGGSTDEVVGDLNKFRNKLEQVVPGSFKAKYNITSEEMIVTIQVERTSQAQSIHYKLEDMIKSVAKSLNFT